MVWCLTEWQTQWEQSLAAVSKQTPTLTTRKTFLGRFRHPGSCMMMLLLLVARMGSSSNSYFPTPAVPVRDQFKVVGILGIQFMVVLSMILWIESEMKSVVVSGEPDSRRTFHLHALAQPRLSIRSKVAPRWPLCPSHSLPSLIFKLNWFSFVSLNMADDVSATGTQYQVSSINFEVADTHKKTGSGSSTWSSGGSLPPSSTHLPWGQR